MRFLDLHKPFDLFLGRLRSIGLGTTELRPFREELIRYAHKVAKQTKEIPTIGVVKLEARELVPAVTKEFLDSVQDHPCQEAFDWVVADTFGIGYVAWPPISVLPPFAPIHRPYDSIPIRLPPDPEWKYPTPPPPFRPPGDLLKSIPIGSWIRPFNEITVCYETPDYSISRCLLGLWTASSTESFIAHCLRFSDDRDLPITLSKWSRDDKVDLTLAMRRILDRDIKGKMGQVPDATNFRIWAALKRITAFTLSQRGLDRWMTYRQTRPNPHSLSRSKIRGFADLLEKHQRKGNLLAAEEIIDWIEPQIEVCGIHGKMLADLTAFAGNWCAPLSAEEVLQGRSEAWKENFCKQLEFRVYEEEKRWFMEQVGDVKKRMVDTPHSIQVPDAKPVITRGATWPAFDRRNVQGASAIIRTVQAATVGVGGEGGVGGEVLEGRTVKEVPGVQAKVVGPPRIRRLRPASNLQYLEGER